MVSDVTIPANRPRHRARSPRGEATASSMPSRLSPCPTSPEIATLVLRSLLGQGDTCGCMRLAWPVGPLEGSPRKNVQSVTERSFQIQPTHQHCRLGVVQVDRAPLPIWAITLRVWLLQMKPYLPSFSTFKLSVGSLGFTVARV